MPLAEDILALVQQMPDTDPPPPTPPAPEGEKPKPGPQHWKGKLTGPSWPDAQKIYDKVLDAGREGVIAVIDLIKSPDTAPDHKPRYLLNGLASYVCRKGMDKQRATVNAALIARLGDGKPAALRANLVRIAQVCGDASVLPSLAPMLADDELCAPAAQAMANIGGPVAAEHLRKAMANAGARTKMHIVQALGNLRDAAAAAILLQAADDADADVRLAALWSLARAGAAEATDSVLKATEATDTWPRTQATRAALLLADNLAAAGKKPLAARIYKHLIDTRADPKESHIRAAAEAGLATL